MRREVLDFIITAKKDGYNLVDEVNIDGNIIIPQTAEEPWYYVRYNDVWYSVKFLDKKQTEIKEDFCAKEYYEDYYLNKEK